MLVKCLMEDMYNDVLAIPQLLEAKFISTFQLMVWWIKIIRQQVLKN